MRYTTDRFFLEAIKKRGAAQCRNQDHGAASYGLSVAAGMMALFLVLKPVLSPGMRTFAPIRIGSGVRHCTNLRFP